MRRMTPPEPRESERDPADDLLNHEETVVLKRARPLREWTFEPRVRVEPGTNLMTIMGKDEDSDENPDSGHG